MSDMSPAVRVRGLVKSYGPVQAVRGIDLDIHADEIFALLGPNGAGKTTTIEILEGYRSRDSGRFPRHRVQLGRRHPRGGMGNRRGAHRDQVLPLGAPP